MEGRVFHPRILWFLLLLPLWNVSLGQGTGGATRRLEVLVLDVKGEPVRMGVNLDVVGENSRISSKIESRAFFDLRPGHYRVSCWTDMYVCPSRLVTLTDADNEPRHIVIAFRYLPREGPLPSRVIGKITHAQSSKKTVVVRLLHRNSGVVVDDALVDPNGTFSLSAPWPGTYLVLVTATAMVTEVSEVTVSPMMADVALKAIRLSPVTKD